MGDFDIVDFGMYQCPDTSGNEPPRRTFNHKEEYEGCRERYVNYVLNADTLGGTRLARKRR
jgi:hypothetical protein